MVLLCSVKKLKQEVLLDQCCLHLVKWSIQQTTAWFNWYVHYKEVGVWNYQISNQTKLEFWR